MAWQIKKLGEILKLEYGKPLPDSKRKIDGKYPVYGANGEKDRSDDFYFDKPSVIVGRKGSAGELTLVQEKFWPLDVTYFATFDDKKYDLKFLYNLLETLELPKLAKGVKPGINRNDIYSIEVNIPPLPEQKHIVKILDEAFEKIEKAKENAEKNLKNSKELFESYLQSVFANPGNDWEEKKISEVCDLKSGTTISTKLERKQGDVLYTKIADMNLPENLVEMKTSSRFVNSDEIKKNQIIPEGAVIFPKRGGAIATNKKRRIVKPTIVDLNTMAIIPSKKIDEDYFFHWFQLIDLNEISNGTTIAQINNYSFDEVYIPYPVSLSEQKSIVAKLDALSAEIKKLEEVYEKKLADLEELKKSVLKKAFSGEL